MHVIAAGMVASAIFVGPVAAETVERTVKTGMRTAVGGFSIYNTGTCYAGEIIEGKLEQPPANGAIELMVRKWTLPKDNRCAGTKVKGTVIVYTPRKGFKGTDEAVISFPFSPSGGPGLYRYTYRIKVE